MAKTKMLRVTLASPIESTNLKPQLTGLEGLDLTPEQKEAFAFGVSPIKTRYGVYHRIGTEPERRVNMRFIATGLSSSDGLITGITRSAKLITDIYELKKR